MRTALITGSGRREGLGFETAWQLAAEGFHVILSARTVDQVEPLAGELAQEGFDASALELDLLDRASAAEAARQVEERFGRLDVLINNADVMMPSPTVADKDLDELMFEFQTNVVGTWSVTQHMLPLLVAGGSRPDRERVQRRRGVLGPRLRAGQLPWLRDGRVRPAAESARGVVWAATLPDGGPTGLFFRDGKQLPW
ncbi:SDR family NAD(P)-dependent oxidoreductase [Streptomyces sp. OM5714]|uniref:SDR family NAD(P)-dependent oxidoreductase n=1 Tax=Streptomyces sp. OM5714 TaxID=2602736 RepID=UPI00196A0ADA|nr:SDR family NAD(P)-dependent oxidoreductase [Streptomyces sp. OM5714]KAF2775348.1 short-chain dehydrogenase/reductase SDR [Streptomyces sp. OM5714]